MAPEGKRMLMSGGSRGIGLAIALRAAQRRRQRGAAGQDRRAAPAPRGDGLHRRRGDRGGGRPGAADRWRRPRRRPVELAAVAQTTESFGGIDIVVNNATRSTSPAARVAMKRYDLMQTSTRAAPFCSRASACRTSASDNPHVLTLSPPLSLDPKWFAPAPRLHAGEVRDEHVHAGHGGRVRRRRDRLQLAVAAHADRHRRGPEPARRRRRDGTSRHRPAIVADAASAILTRPAHATTGNFSSTTRCSPPPGSPTSRPTWRATAPTSSSISLSTSRPDPRPTVRT